MSGVLLAGLICALPAWPADPPAPVPAVQISKFTFSPQTLTIKVGDTVTWNNRDEEPHTVMSSAGMFRSAALDTHDSFSYKFDKPGKYKYFCTVHPYMLGTVVVE